jgi:non-ribosomal peptide synthetase component F
MSQAPIGWHSTHAEFPDDSCIHELFAAQARCAPDGVAVAFLGRELSYRELDRLANRLAHHLRSLGVGPEVLVGLCAERSLDVAVGVLAILKAGGAYVPLDPAYPAARLDFMLQDAAIHVLLNQRALGERLPPGEYERVFLDDAPPDGPEEDPPAPVNPAATDDLAYVIYTSGSTGRPKGVAVTHRPMCNLTWWQVHRSPLGRPARTLQLASLSFDVSVQEMFTTWCAGGILVMVPEDTRRDPGALLECMARESIERIFLPFSALQQLAVAAGQRDDLPCGLREIVTAGEPLRITPEIIAWVHKLPGCARCTTSTARPRRMW